LARLEEVKEKIDEKLHLDHSIDRYWRYYADKNLTAFYRLYTDIDFLACTVFDNGEVSINFLEGEIGDSKIALHTSFPPEVSASSIAYAIEEILEKDGEKPTEKSDFSKEDEAFLKNLKIKAKFIANMEHKFITELVQVGEHSTHAYRQSFLEQWFKVLTRETNLSGNLYKAFKILVKGRPDGWKANDKETIQRLKELFA
jgi:hypothetical protein